MFSLFHMEGKLLEGRVDSAGQFPDGLAPVHGVQLGKIRDLERFSKADEHIGPKSSAGLELKSHRDNQQTQVKVGSRFRFQGDAGRTRLDGCYLGIVLAEALWKDGGGKALAKEFGVAVQGLQISSATPRIVLGAHQWDGPEGLQNEPQRTGKKGVLGPKVEGPGNQVNQNGRIEQGIGMIGHQKDRAVLGDGLRPLYLDGAVVHPKGDAEKHPNE